MSVLRRRAVLASSVAASLCVPAVVRASDWPKGTIKFVVPFPPGGSTDPIARLIQAKVSDQQTTTGLTSATRRRVLGLTRPRYQPSGRLPVTRV